MWRAYGSMITLESEFIHHISLTMCGLTWEIFKDYIKMVFNDITSSNLTASLMFQNGVIQWSLNLIFFQLFSSSLTHVNQSNIHSMSLCIQKKQKS